MWLQRAERIRTQQRDTKNKLYALHAPEVECISKGKARNPYEFGVKVSLAVTHKQGLMVGARSFPGNPYDGHVLSAQLEQTNNLLQDLGRSPKQVVVDLGYRGVDADNPGVQIIHRGKYKSLTEHEKRLLKRRQAIEPLIGNTRSDHPDKLVLAAGCNGRCVTCAELCGGLQHPLAAAGDRPPWPGQAFLRPVGCVRVPRLLAASLADADKTGEADPIASAQTVIQSPMAVTCWAQMNSAGPTT